ncbi:two-component system alkaline phosphatase synthesis response regulator PhoP [Kroppenstedtia sanguinis]|uniref:response regulator n=1 Tax=Kroppenstedtia sanguinis TaxID=1380684 RepID=UPI003D1FB126
MSKQKVLVVDDEPSIVKLVQFNLEKEGFAVEVASDGPSALAKVVEGLFDLIVLDLMLPQMDGLEVCKEIRKKNSHLPILMLTAKNEEFDKVLGLELGADDYMTKPFSPRELVARVKAILRRMGALREQGIQEDRKYLRVGELEMDTEGYEVRKNGDPVDLTPKEFELLIHLASHRGKVLSRDQLLNAVWDYDYIGDTRIVDVHVSHLREKVEEDSRNPIYIKTVRGIGYKFEGPKES